MTDRHPGAYARFCVHPTISNDFLRAVGQQPIDQDAAAVFGVPHPQLGEEVDGALAGRLTAKERRALDDEADFTPRNRFACLDRLRDGSQGGRRESDRALCAECHRLPQPPQTAPAAVAQVFERLALRHVAWVRATAPALQRKSWARRLSGLTATA